MNLEQQRSHALEVHQAGDLQQAEALYRAILRAAPHDGQAWHYLGVLRGQQGRPAEVVRCCEQAVRNGYAAAAVHRNLGLARLELGQDNAGLQALAEALRLNPADAELALDTAGLLSSRGREAEALAILRQACDATPGDDRLWTELAQLAAQLNDGELAESAFRQAAQLQPDEASCWLNLGSVQQMRGNNDSARRNYLQALSLKPGWDAACWALAQVISLQSDAELAQSIVSRASSVPGADSAPMQFAAAKLLHDAGQVEAAFGAYQAGNRLIRAGYDYAVEKDMATLSRLTEVMRQMPDVPAGQPDDAAPRPLFVVGLPRSGSTLLEQMLARHSAIDAGGEIVWLQRDVRDALRTAGLNYPDDQLKLSDAQCGAIRQRYGDALRARSKGGAIITDKLPANFLCLPLIRRLFPGALVLHARRDLLQTCWSCYRHLFTGRQQFAYELEELGRYATSVHAFMHAAQQRWPDHVLEVSYERLVEQPQRVLGEVLNRLGLHWEEQCLLPQNSTDVVLTASATQVRQGLARQPFAGAAAYRAYLQPLESALRLEASSRNTSSADQNV